MAVQRLGQEWNVPSQLHAVVLQSVAAGKQSRQQRPVRRKGPGGRADGVVEDGSIGGQRVDVWRGGGLVAVDPEVVGTQRVHGDDDEVRREGLGSLAPARARGRQEQSHPDPAAARSLYLHWAYLERLQRIPVGEDGSGEETLVKRRAASA